MRKVIHIIIKIWSVLFLIGKIVTIPYRYGVWRPLRWFFRSWFGRFIKNMAIKLLGIVVIFGVVGVIFGHSEMVKDVSRFVPKFNCPPLVGSVPGIGGFCMSEFEAAMAEDDFEENILELHEGERPHNFFGDEEEKERVEPVSVKDFLDPTPAPEITDDGLPKCERCMARLVDRDGDRGVIDGDTLRVEYAGVEFKFRLRGIDAYEINQTCGEGEAEWQCGAESRAGLVGKLSWSEFVYFTYEADGKYHKPSHDRYVVDIFDDRYAQFRVGESMVMDGFAEPLPDFLREGERETLAGYHKDAKARFMGVYREGQTVMSPRAYRRLNN